MYFLSLPQLVKGVSLPMSMEAKEKRHLSNQKRARARHQHPQSPPTSLSMQTLLAQSQSLSQGAVEDGQMSPCSTKKIRSESASTTTIGEDLN